MAHLSRVRRLRRRERARRSRFIAGGLIALVFIAVSLVHLSRGPAAPASDSVPATRQQGPAPLLAISTEPAEPTTDVAGEPLVFPYSIVPGGVPTPAALAAAVAADPIVRAHYASFDLTRTRLVRLTQPRVAHVSYRIGDNVFWTRRPLLLPAGETVLTDGVHYARTRCANLLAATPGAVSADEPTAQMLDTPLTARAGARVFPAVALPAAPGAARPNQLAKLATSVPGGPFSPQRTPKGAGTLVDPPTPGDRAFFPARADADPIFPAHAEADPIFALDPGSSPDTDPGDGPGPDDVRRWLPTGSDDSAPRTVPEADTLMMLLVSGVAWLTLRRRPSAAWRALQHIPAAP